MTIRSQAGTVVTLDVPPDAKRFDQVKVGGTVTAYYYDRVSVRLKPAGEPAVDRTDPPTTTATMGALPGATRTRQRVTTVTITGWDAVNKVVSFTGPNGTSYTRRLLDSTDPKIAEGLKKGDRVDITRTEAVTVTVQPAAEDTLRNRLTVSVLFGWDNQFSGKMIKEATGRTTGGVPINLDETTYDEVYGRMGMLKIGVGYRTTPRTEGVFNFVWSSSSSEETATRIGTIGRERVPLNVHFTDYKYWGIEGGQRWFFARTRFTPFVGYLVGINRLQDIHGTFANVPSHAGACRAGRQVLREVVGVQPGSDRWHADRHWSDRVHGRDAVPFHGRAVGRGLAGRRRPARRQQRELALVVPDSAGRARPVLRR